MFRVLGDDPQQVRAVAEQVRQVFKADPATRDVNFDWNELAKTVRLEVDQNKARALGVDSQILGNTLQTLLSGVTVTQYRERTEIDRRGGPRRAGRAAERRGAGGDQPADRQRRRGVARPARDAALRARGADPVAAQQGAADDGARRRGRRRAGPRRRRPHRQGAGAGARRSAGGLSHRGRRRQGGERQEPGLDLQDDAGDGLPDDAVPDAAAAELLQARAGRC